MYDRLLVIAATTYNGNEGAPEAAQVCPAEWTVCETSETCLGEFSAAETQVGPPTSGSGKLTSTPMMITT